jgi:hypothetical protein
MSEGTVPVDLNISWLTIFMISSLGFAYTVGASVGIDTFSKCDKFKGKSVQEGLNKWLIATLGVSIAIPVTLFLAKMFEDETPIFMILYALLGIVGMSAALNWSMNCKNADPSSKSTLGMSLSSFLCALLGGIFMIASNR